MDNFMFFVDDKKIGQVSLTLNGLSFNSESIKQLGSPEFIAVGIDFEAKKIAVKPFNNDIENLKCYKFAAKNNISRIRINSKELHNQILKLVNKKYVKRQIIFQTEFDKDKNLLFLSFIDSPL